MRAHRPGKASGLAGSFDDPEDRLRTQAQTSITYEERLFLRAPDLAEELCAQRKIGLQMLDGRLAEVKNSFMPPPSPPSELCAP